MLSEAFKKAVFFSKPKKEKKKSKSKEQKPTIDVNLKEVMYLCRTMNVWLRRNVTEGWINRISCSEHERRSLHRLRKLLSVYYKEPIEYFEPIDWVEHKRSKRSVEENEEDFPIIP